MGKRPASGFLRPVYAKSIVTTACRSSILMRHRIGSNTASQNRSEFLPGGALARPTFSRRTRMTADKNRGAAAERLRADIDSGSTGDKVAFPDPSAAPLGTDEEAGGVTTPEQALEKARQAELRLAQNVRRDAKKGERGAS